jgi:hypothetical protein
MSSPERPFHISLCGAAVGDGARRQLFLWLGLVFSFFQYIYLIRSIPSYIMREPCLIDLLCCLRFLVRYFYDVGTNESH